MGGWAVFANRMHAMPVPIIAGVVQGMLTATITLFLKGMIESIFQRTDSWMRLALPSVAAFMISFILLTTIHTIAGTPSLFATISVPLAVSTLYALFYTLALSRHV